MEFMNLVQGNRTVDEYESKFMSLGRYDPDTMGSETRKIQKFMDGLRLAIRTKLAPFDILTYEEAVHKAQLCE